MNMVLYSHVHKAKLDNAILCLITAAGQISGKYDNDMMDRYEELPGTNRLEVIPLKDVQIIKFTDSSQIITNMPYLAVYPNQVIASTVQE